MCGKCSKNEMESCHSVCNCIPFDGNIIDCQIFGNARLPKDAKTSYHCLVCGHEDKYHCHSKQFSATIEKKEEKIDKNRKNVFLETQNELDS